jgi:hypothetical protein
MVLIDLNLDTSISGLPSLKLNTLTERRFHPRGRYKYLKVPYFRRIVNELEFLLMTYISLYA